MESERLADEDGEGVESLTKRQAREKKELQAEVQRMKRAAGQDKKWRKELMAKVAALEDELAKRHAQEAAAEPEPDARPTDENVAPKPDHAMAALSVQLDAAALDDAPAKAPKKSKAQKRRERRNNSEKTRQSLIADEEKNAVDGARLIENRLLLQQLTPLRLAIDWVPADGDCLFRALANQLKAVQYASAPSPHELRRLAADYIRARQEQFCPFLECNSDAEFGAYCERIAETSAWGGHVELTALCECLRVPIVVYQAASAPLIFGEHFHAAHTLRLSYHRYALSQGEHYNSVLPRSAQADADLLPL